MEDVNNGHVSQAAQDFATNPSQSSFNAFEQACITMQNALFGSKNHAAHEQNQIKLNAFFSELFAEESCRRYMMHMELSNRPPEEYLKSHSKDNTKKDIIITSHYMKAHIIDETINKIKGIKAYLTAIGSYHASNKSLFSPFPVWGLVYVLSESLAADNPDKYDLENTFATTGNFTHLTERYDSLLEKYSIPSNNVALRSYSEQASYITCSFIRGILRPLDYIWTLITTGELKAGWHQLDVNHGGEKAYIKLPTFESLNKLSLFTKEVKTLVSTYTPITFNSPVKIEYSLNIPYRHKDGDRIFGYGNKSCSHSFHYQLQPENDLTTTYSAIYETIENKFNIFRNETNTPETILLNNEQTIKITLTLLDQSFEKEFSSMEDFRLFLTENFLIRTSNIITY